MIGDIDPEDVYDAGDPPAVRLDVLERVAADLERFDTDTRREARRVDALRVAAGLDWAAGVDRRRLRRIRETLETIGDG